MKLSTLKKALVSLALLVVFAVFITITFIKAEIAHGNGLNTPVIDHTDFQLSDSPVAITRISVLSEDSERMIENQTVLIKDGVIQSISNSSSIPEDYSIIDGNSKYLIPGLADTHAHTYKSKNDLLLYLVNGVTQIAVLSSSPELLDWKKEAEEGALSPQIFLSTAGMNSKEESLMRTIREWFGTLPGINTPEQARKAVKKFKQQGYDAVKVYEWLDKDVYYALIEEANKQKLPVIGHMPQEISLEELYQSGQSQLAHIEEITKATMEDFGGIYRKEEAYLEYLNQHADSIAKKVKASGITVSSTVWLMDTLPKQRFDLENFLKTIELEYQNSGIIEGSYFMDGWLPGSNRYEAQYIGLKPENFDASMKFNQTYVKAIHIMAKALIDNDVTIITGTDSNTAGTIAGFSTHDELQSLSNSGLTNPQILNAATLAPSKWMNFNSGKIAKGLRADLVILDKNPLEDISNTRSISSVILNGKVLDRGTLDSILEKIKQANESVRKINIDKYLE